jgi:hypothetical protein
MTKRKTPPVQVHPPRGRLAPYRRLEMELANARHSLTEAVESYLTAVVALQKLLQFYDRKDSSWTPAEVAELEEIRAWGAGKEALNLQAQIHTQRVSYRRGLADGISACLTPEVDPHWPADCPEARAWWGRFLESRRKP